MSEAKMDSYIATGLTVLVTLMIYNLVIKAYTPTFLRNWIGLG